MPHILIVEDEAVLRITFAQFLEDDGYDVVTVEDYGEAMVELHANDYDVVVTDIIMAGMTGLDLLRAIRENELSCPVIMITGEPTVESASEAVRHGAFDYLSKPVTGKELKRVVRLALDHKKLREERDHYAARADILRREFETIFQSVNEGLITVDVDMRLHQINKAAESMLGISSDRAMGEPFGRMQDGQFEAAREALEQTLSTGEVVVDRRIEVTLGPKNYKVLLFSTSSLIDKAGFNTGAVLMIRDLTRLTLLENKLEDPAHYRQMVGKSTKMQEVFALVKSVADTESTVLLCGESGTGKELVAAALHEDSSRADGPFVKVNCAALSEDILESELFGHVKGAFTGAVKDRIGRFEAAVGGTILLDEIGDISPRLQLRLLRVLQEKEFERVGDSTPIAIDVRIIAATNQDLTQKMREGSFRQDLYYRLNVVRIEIPPLRERKDDIVVLADTFCRRFNGRFKKEVTGLAPEAMDRLMSYSWPGNIRELENCIERAFIVCQGPVILSEHLPPEIAQNESPASVFALHPPREAEKSVLDRELIQEVLQRTDWNVAKTARTLGIARNTLYQKMKSLDIARPGE